MRNVALAKSLNACRFGLQFCNVDDMADYDKKLDNVGCSVFLAVIA